MEYYIKQKVFSWKDRFTVKDSQGRDVYQVEGEFFSFGKKLRVLDMSGKEVLYIEQRVWRLLPTYHLYMGNEEVAVVKKDFTFLRPSYTIQGPDWQVEGSVWQHNYQITENGRVVADISKEWFSWGDSYALRINEESNPLIALGVIIIIDCVIASQKAGANGGT